MLVLVSCTSLNWEPLFYSTKKMAWYFSIQVNNKSIYLTIYWLLKNHTPLIAVRLFYCAWLWNTSFTFSHNLVLSILGLLFSLENNLYFIEAVFNIVWNNDVFTDLNNVFLHSTFWCHFIQMKCTLFWGIMINCCLETLINSTQN